MNLFLRDSLYNRYLSDSNKLYEAEHLFELPLDSYTGKALRKAGRQAFVRWGGVGELTTELNRQMQDAAAAYGAQQGIYRVHFDTMWWGR